MADLWVAFRTEDGGWSEPRNLGPEVKSEVVDDCPMATPDAEILFFSHRDGATWDETTAGDVFWVDAAILERFR